MPATQSAQSHARFYPLFHFVVLPLLVLNIVFTVAYAVRHFDQHRHLVVWMVVMSVVLLLMAGAGRAQPLRAQDRIIRLEERMRLMSLAPGAEVAGVSEAQWIALRFASDAELPALAERAARENLTPEQIKQAIKSWRADHFRV